VNALVFAPGEATALAEQVRRLEREPELAGRLLAGARETADGLSIDRIVDQLEDELARVKRKSPHA
jgi:hypothetical protein